MRHLLVAALAASLAPSLAHAEFLAKPKSDVRPIGPALVTEPLTVDHILDKIQTSYMPHLRRCYNRGLANDPTLGGKVTVMFTVSPYGRVRGAAIGIGPKVDACLTSALTKWRFTTATPRKEATFRLNLVLSR